MSSRTFQTLSHILRTTASHRPLPIPLTPKLYTTTRNASSSAAKRLEGKTVLITGASSGIGRSTAKEFARTSPKNLRLILTARRLEKLHELAQEIREEVGEGVKIHNVKMDVSKPAEVSAFVHGLPEEFKSIDVLVNNAFVYSILRSHELLLTHIQWPRKRRRQSPKHKTRRYNHNVLHKRNRPNKHDPSHPTPLQRSHSSTRRHNKHRLHSRPRRLPLRFRILCYQGRRQDIHRCPPSRTHKYKDTSHGG